MKAVITVVGKDKVGILAEISAICAEYNINILEVTQSVLDNLFCMIMICDISKISIEFTKFASIVDDKAKSCNLQIHTMHEDIFNSMHNI